MSYTYTYTYSFNHANGNLLSRKDLIKNRTETFTYDQLDRLSTVKLTS